MIRPELLAVKGQRARREWNRSDLFEARRFRMHIKPCHAPLFGLVRNILVFAATQHVERPINESVAADLFPQLQRSYDFAGIVELMNLPFIPLTQVTILAVKAEI